VTDTLPFAKLLGIEIIQASPEKVTAEMAVREDLCTRPPVLHGGAIMSLGDTVGAVATMLNLPEGGGTTTIESKTNFLGPALNGATVVAECTPIHRGKRTMVWQTRISTKESRLVAIVTQTQLIL
jgi:1,4-dihydroxy-2-naphthoyl-CoA hydrolase